MELVTIEMLFTETFALTSLTEGLAGVAEATTATGVDYLLGCYKAVAFGLLTSTFLRVNLCGSFV